MRGYGLLTAGLVLGLSEIVVRVVHCVFVLRVLPETSLSLAKIDFRLLREMLPYGMNTFLYAMGAVIIHHASTLIIGIFIGAAQISQFAAAAAAVLLLSMLLTACGLEIPIPSRTSVIGFVAGWLAVAALVGGFLLLVGG